MGYASTNSIPCGAPRYAYTRCWCASYGYGHQHNRKLYSIPDFNGNFVEGLSVGVDDLSKQITEYQMRVESVLNGMDTVLTNLDNRLKKLEQVVLSGSVRHTDDVKQTRRMDQLEQQVALLTAALHDLIAELDHD